MVSKGEMWVLTRTASRSHIVKSGQAHIGLITNYWYKKSLHRLLSVLGSIVVSIPACHVGDRGSIPRRRGFSFFNLCLQERQPT